MDGPFPLFLILTTQFLPISLAMNTVLMVWLFIKDRLHDVISNEENLLNRIKSLESVDFEKEQKVMKVVFLVISAYLTPATCLQHWMLC